MIAGAVSLTLGAVIVAVLPISSTPPTTPDWAAGPTTTGSSSPAADTTEAPATSARDRTDPASTASSPGSSGAPTGSSTGPADAATSSRPGIIESGSSVEQAVDLADGMLGPSQDPIGELARFVEVPDPLPTPLGASVIASEFRVSDDFRSDASDPRTFSVSTRVRYQVVGNYRDVTAFFDAAMTAAGYTRGPANEATTNGLKRYTVGYDPREANGSDATDPLAALDTDWRIDVEVEEQDGLPLEVEISRTTPTTANFLRRYVEWCDGAPLYEPAKLLGVVLSAEKGGSTFVDGISAGCTYLVEGTEEEAIDAVQSALPTGGFELREAYSGFNITMTRDGFDYTSMYFNNADPSNPGSVEATLTMSVQD